MDDVGDLSSLRIPAVLRRIHQFLLPGGVEDHEYDTYGRTRPVPGKAGAGRAATSDGED